MHAENEETLDSAVANIHNLSNKFPQFVKRFDNFYNRKTQWVLLFRLNYIYTRGNNTNNYAEASIRVLKEIVLSRNKAYNVTALVESISNVWEDYLTNRILDHAHVRKDEIVRSYYALCKQMNHLDLKNIIDHHNGLFSVPSSSNGNVYYIVNMSIGVCNCTVGKVGAFCKHQAWLHKYLNLPLPNAPPVTSKERYLLGQLALGEKCPSLDWFLGLKENLNPFVDNINSSIVPHDQKNEVANTIKATIIELETSNTNKNINNTSEIEQRSAVTKDIEEEIVRLQSLLSFVPLDVCEKLSKKLKVIKNAQQLTSFIVKTNRNLSSVNKRRQQIKVQPTAISRRRPGVTRGSKRIPSGRPPTTIAKNKNKKRLHNLNQNINKNQMNATYHGRCS